MSVERSEHLEKLFKAACRADVGAIKPGNVSVYAAGHRMHSEDFINSAKACASVLCMPRSNLGERILRAVQATRKAVPKNTNLGIILLCAPLIQAFYCAGKKPLRYALRRVLTQTTVNDARAVYRAIRLSEAGGLGRVAQADIGSEPDISLLKAMQLAQQRDLIAAQYAHAYRDLFDYAYPALLAFYSKWGYTLWAVSGIYMKLLATYPDSLIARKRGEAIARQVCQLASVIYEKYCCVDKPRDLGIRLLEFDRELKEGNINPGTTADLTVATIFLAGLESINLN